MLFTKKNQRKKGDADDILLQPRGDRRDLNHAPDPTNARAGYERRGDIGFEDENHPFEAAAKQEQEGRRYHVDCPVTMQPLDVPYKYHLQARVRDLSASGLLVEFATREDYDRIRNAEWIKLRFQIPAGAMPEGYEMKVRLNAQNIRCFEKEGRCYCGLEFEKNLNQYARETKDRRMFFGSAVILSLVTAIIVLMRVKNVLYFRFHEITYFYSLMAAIFLLSRYLLAVFYKPVPVNRDFTPGVTVIIPCFNEEEWIHRTITSCLNQNYPTDKLEVIVVDDCSTDNSVEQIRACIDRLIENDGGRTDLENRVSYYVQPKNAGKREALVEGVMRAKHDLVVFVDSDSFLDPYAIRNLVQPFQDPKMGGVSGRTDVANTYTNDLTRMQAVRYYIAFRIMKAAESVFDCVTCLSGPLACYRKDIVLEKKDEWLNQRFLGQKATFGDDRSMTNYILRHYRTCYQDTAICSTIVPNKYRVFLKQQMRWKRSWLRESLRAGGFFWRKEPLAAILFYVGLIVPIAAPFIICYNLVYVPLVEHIFPSTFLIGILMMALMMSGTQLLLRKSSTWLYALWFCLYYEAVLVWQMPYAMLTFWKSTWGTRMTWSDVQEVDRDSSWFRRLFRKKEPQAQTAQTPRDENVIESYVPKAAAPDKNYRPHYTGSLNRRKEWGKGLRTCCQILLVVLLAGWLVKSSFFPRQYVPYTDAPVSDDRGFVAISYNNVSRTGSETELSSRQLEKQLSQLKANGYVTIRQQDILDYYQTGKPLPEKALLLLFEDGMTDTAIFSQKVLEKMNYLATNCGYAQSIAEPNDVYLDAGDILELEESTFWEPGSNGYRLSYINIFDRYDRFIGQMDAQSFVQMRPYLNRDYNHYLMDYIRDENWMPLETRLDMQSRISKDYQLMQEIYTAQLGQVPKLYTLMHANTEHYGNNDEVGSVNEENMKAIFAMNFNREGFSLNNRSADLYNLTRMTVSAYWSPNHLLMRLWDDLEGANKEDIRFLMGDEKKAAQWELVQGAAEFDGRKILLTSPPDGEGALVLKDFRIPEEMELTVNLSGTCAGEQILRLGEDLKLIIGERMLILSQAGTHLAEVDLTSLLEDAVISVEEDKRDALAQAYAVRASQAADAATSLAYRREAEKVRKEQVPTVAEGAEIYVPELQLYERADYRLKLRLAQGSLTVWINGRMAVDSLPVSFTGDTLSLLAGWDAEVYSQRNLTDNVYDGEFSDLVITDQEGTTLFDNRPQGFDAVRETAEQLLNRVVDWFIVNT